MDFNDWQNNWSPAKITIKNNNNTIKRYYSNKNNINIKDNNEEQNIEKIAWHEIIMPYDLYTSKVLEDVGLLMTPTSFKTETWRKSIRILRSLTKCFLNIIEMLTMLPSG